MIYRRRMRRRSRMENGSDKNEFNECILISQNWCGYSILYIVMINHYRTQRQATTTS